MSVSPVGAFVCPSGSQGRFKGQGAWCIAFHPEALLRGTGRGRRPLSPSSTGNENVYEETSVILSPGTEGTHSASVSA